MSRSEPPRLSRAHRPTPGAGPTPPAARPLSAEQALRSSEERFHALFRSSPVAIAIATVHSGRLVDVNDRYAELFGYRRDELLGRTVGELNFWADPRQRNRVLRAFREHPPTRGVECSFRRRDGGTFTALLSLEELLLPHEPVFIASLVDISEKRRIEAQIAASRDNLRNLNARLLAVREEERRMMAREIHDELGQALTALRIELSRLQPRVAAQGEALGGEVGALVSVVDRLTETARQLTRRLRPPVLDDLGLEAAVEWQAAEFARTTGCPCEVNFDGTPPPADDTRDTALFRILQEALTNVARHAGASYVHVHLRSRHRRYTLEVRDDGRGIDAAEIGGARSLGLMGMRERAGALGGRLRVQRLPGGGTSVRAELPLAGAAEQRP